MPSMPGRRAALFSVLVAASIALLPGIARANLDTFVGPRVLVQNKPLVDCTANAKNALNSVLHNAFEAGDGTAQWLAYGPPDSSGHATAAAAIHCYTVGSGYSATFTCAAQVPPNPDTAPSLCSKLTTAFGAGKTALIAPSSAGGTSWK